MKKPEIRQRTSLDSGWRFALGHAYDPQQDFEHGIGHFSYLTKTGYGDGAAAQNFDDRGWRALNVPHDWCVELPFDLRGSHSHGYKAIGRAFPQNSVGWYRKNFFIPATDLGKRIAIEFDGVHRDSIVWVNGFYLGTEHSGYTSFHYDISDYLNYGGNNAVAVRADATLEEGWYYEGAGMYRHAWLTKTAPLHVARHGTFVTTELEDGTAQISVRTTVVNEADQAVTFDIEETLRDPEGNSLLTGSNRQLSLQPGELQEYVSQYCLEAPRLWSHGNPVLHHLITVLRSDGEMVDDYQTPFGIRTVRFDPDDGFFLNGERVKIVGVNLHQDHAGVGVAIPDALHAYRIQRLQAMGCNTIRTAHNPPAPEFLDACDQLGMLVIDENRLMGCNAEHFSCLERLMKRDRNHPSVILWSLGNEEWAVEGKIKGARITETMQKFAGRLDPSRVFTVGISGGWDDGIGTAVQVMGYNYIVQGDIDAHHAKFPWQPAIGTEETTTHQTRGTYRAGNEPAYIPPTNRMPENVGTESGWQFFAARPFLGGLCYWTGLDYRGEPDPFKWPAVINQSGLLDLCGFAKDGFHYLKAWWRKEPALHIASHWNWPGHEDQEVNVTAYGNCDQVALFLNDESLGSQEMPPNGHLEWSVRYQPGMLLARGYTQGQQVAEAVVTTSGTAAKIGLRSDRSAIAADGQDVAIITVDVQDEQGRLAPAARNEIHFTLQGPGRIMGVGNGDPISHEPDCYFEAVSTARIHSLKEKVVEDLANRPEVAPGYDDSGWKPAFQYQSVPWDTDAPAPLVVRGILELAPFSPQASLTLLTKSVVDDQSIYVNGHLVAANISRDAPDQAFPLPHEILSTVAANEIAITGRHFCRKQWWEEPNTDPGLVQVIEPAPGWKRRVFNGLAQVIIQSDGPAGELTLTVAADGLTPATVRIQANGQSTRP